MINRGALELRQLHYFLVVAEELNFGRAAQRLHIVQPAVSQQIRRLEQELGVELFERTTRRVTLTEAGRDFVPQARAVVAAEERALASMRNGPGAASRLHVGTATGLGRRLPAALAGFYETSPGVTVELVNLPETERIRRVRDRTLDAAIVRGHHAETDLRVEPIWHDDLIAVVPAGHELATVGELTLPMLTELPLRLVDRALNPTLVDALYDACRTAGFEPIVAGGLPTTSDADLLAAIAAGSPTWTIYFASRAEMLNAGAIGVAFVPFRAPGISIPTALAMRADRDDDLLARFVENCRLQA